MRRPPRARCRREHPGGGLHVRPHTRREPPDSRGPKHGVHEARHQDVVQADRGLPEGRRHRHPDTLPPRPRGEPQPVPQGQGDHPLRRGAHSPRGGVRRGGIEGLRGGQDRPHPRPLPRGVLRVRRCGQALRHSRRHNPTGGQLPPDGPASQEHGQRAGGPEPEEGVRLRGCHRARARVPVHDQANSKQWGVGPEGPLEAFIPRPRPGCTRRGHPVPGGSRRR